MFVFEIVTPGTWLDYEDKHWLWKIQGQLRLLESQFFEANAALNLFIAARTSRSPLTDHRANIESDSQRRSEIQRAIEQERGGVGSWEDVHFETEVRFKREQWSSGRCPGEFERTLPFIYARAFLYALDAFGKVLAVLAKEDNVPDNVATLQARFEEVFPDLRGVRDTAQHLEDRARGLDRNKQPLDLKPISNAFIDAPGGGVLAIGCLNGSRYGSTKSDGRYGEVDVSPDSMRLLQMILQGVLQSFKWRGSRQHGPSA